MDPAFLSRIESYLTNRPFTEPNVKVETLQYIGGIVGGEEPSRYSQSPLLWNRLFQRLGIPAYFAPFDLPPTRELVPFMETVLQAPFCLDLTVTNPYKHAAYRALEQLHLFCSITDRVHNLQSLNHILLQPDGWFVDSTDGEGMVRAIEKRTCIEGKRVLLVGAGGAAASIGYELVRKGVELRIANIIEEDAHALEERLSRAHGALFKGFASSRPVSDRQPIFSGGWDRIPQWAEECEVIISAITESSPLDEEGIRNLPPSVILADTRYGDPAEFARLGRSLGRTVIDGKEMLFGQFHGAALRVASTLGIPQPLICKVLEEIEVEYLSS